MTKAAKKWILMLLALAMLAGCGSQGATPPQETPDVLGGTAPGKELAMQQAADDVFSLGYDPNGSMNPIQATSSTNMQFWGLMYDSVFTVDESFNLTSEIVTSWNSDDYIWWVFNIDTTIPFHDGETLTAADVAYSIQRAQQSAYYKQRLSCIYGISALSKETFAITTKEANSQFPKLLNIPIIKKGDYFEDRPVGTGPYRLDEAGDKLVLFPDNRHADRMPIDVIYLRDETDTSQKIYDYQNHTIDLVTNDPTGIYSLGYGSGNDTRYYNTTNLHYIGFNLDSMFFQTAAARRAVSYVVDRDYVVTDLMDGCGLPTTLPVHPISSLYNAALGGGQEYDPEKCMNLFVNAGVGDHDHDGALEMLITGIIVELNFRFIVNNDSTVKVQAARRITQELNSLGITTTLHELGWADYIEALEKGEYDMYYGEIRLSPDWDLRYLFQPREEKDKDKDDDAPFEGMNYADNKDPRYCQLYDAYLAAEDEVTRQAMFAQVCQYISDTGIILPVCFERREVLTHRGIVTGICATQYDLFHKFYEWTIDVQ